VLSGLDATYRRLAPVYDVLYGVGLEHGRRRAMARLAPRAGETLLEVGVGTGLSARSYPATCHVTAVDVSEPMLARARSRLARQGVAHVTLLRMDASRLAFPDGVFDAVYAPYVINVVPDPVAVIREMARVCRPGGRLVLLNHFANGHVEPPIVRMAIGVASRLGGVDSRLQLGPLLEAAGLTAASVDRVNFRISSVVVCHKSPCFHGVHS
jgi:phosphatidylethanolamine/phosphatidyl-N-methylethanolamine N-methyltransferase